MTFLKWTTLGIIALLAIAVSSAQQKFPMRSGEWTASIPDPTPGKPPVVMLYCLNDELWTKALSVNPTCQLNQFNLTPLGANYQLNCAGKAFQMKGNVKLIFDGATHMTSKGSFDTTMTNGQTTHMDSTSEFHWKGPICDPNVDMNLKFKQR